LVTGKEPDELLTPVLHLDDLLLQRLVDPGDRSGELIGVSVEEMADLSERHACISKDLDPHEINNGLCAVAAVARVIPDGLGGGRPGGSDGSPEQ
jgi:hypothetical protein